MGDATMTTKKPDEQPIQTYIEKYDLKADWNYWCKASSWTLFETAHLIHGIDPKKISVQGVDHISRGLRAGDLNFQMALKDYSLLERASNDGLLGLRNQPIAALNYCISYQIKVPQELLDICVLSSERQVEAAEKMKAIRAAQNPESDKTTKAITIKPMGEKKEANLLRLISIMTELMVNEKLKDKFSSVAQMISYITEKFKDIEPEQSGLSKKALDVVLKEARTIRPINQTNKD